MKQNSGRPAKPKTSEPQSTGLKAVYRAVVALVFALVVALVVGSLYAVVRPADSGPLFRIGGQGASSGIGDDGIHGDEQGGWSDFLNVFTGIGRLRIPLSGQPPTTVILSLSFPYPPGDVSFAEELATRVGEFRSIATDYFAAFSGTDIAGLDETTAKNEILSRYNAILRLGRIEELYFTDLIILD